MAGQDMAVSEAVPTEMSFPGSLGLNKKDHWHFWNLAHELLAIQETLRNYDILFLLESETEIH